MHESAACCRPATTGQPPHALRQTELFLSTLHAGRHGWVELRALHPKTRMVTDRGFFPTTQAGLGAAARCGIGLAAAADVYVSALDRKRQAGAAEDVAGGCALFVGVDRELDIAEAPAMLVKVALQRYELPKPDLVVASGSGGLHLYWLLAEPAPTAALAELLKRLAQAIGLPDRSETARRGAHADLCTPAQTLRLPGTLNHKHSPPNPVRLVRCNPAQAHFTATWWGARLPAIALPAPKRQEYRPDGGRWTVERIERLRRATMAAIPEGQRHRTLASYAAWLGSPDVGAPPELVLALLQERADLSPGPRMSAAEIRSITKWGTHARR